MDTTSISPTIHLTPTLVKAASIAVVGAVAVYYGYKKRQSVVDVLHVHVDPKTKKIALGIRNNKAENLFVHGSLRIVRERKETGEDAREAAFSELKLPVHFGAATTVQVGYDLIAEDGRPSTLGGLSVNNLTYPLPPDVDLTGGENVRAFVFYGEDPEDMSRCIDVTLPLNLRNLGGGGIQAAQQNLAFVCAGGMCVGEKDSRQHYYLRDVGKQNQFYIKSNNRETIACARSLDELHNYLLSTPANVFAFHAPSYDFSNWVNSVIGDKELANQISKIEHDGGLNARAKTIEALGSRVRELKAAAPVGASLRPYKYKFRR
ncbi:Uncharacterised protein [uncultured archaeon]|nr:Uncharacterised protein [uncultured archaeon]